MERNVSQMSMLYIVSGAAGPMVAGATMNATHSDALMWFLAVAAVVMLVGLFWLGYVKRGRVATL
jgi:hypothetical protein